MLLVALPSETLLHIASYLRPYEIQPLARTDNKTLTSICLPLLREQLAAVKNERKIVALFGFPERSCQHKMDCKKAFTQHVTVHSGPYAILLEQWPLSSATRVDNLDLADHFTWPQVLPDYRFRNIFHFQCSLDFTPADMARLQDSIQRLGLTLPNGFVEFMTSIPLQNALASVVHCEFPLDALWKVQSRASLPMTSWLPRLYPIAIDGYACRFFRSTNEFMNYYLYMDRTGAHCILRCYRLFADFYIESPNEYADAYEPEHNDGLMRRSEAQTQLQRWLDPTEAEIGMWVMDDVGLKQVSLYATSFEEFLVRMYFEEGLSRYWAYNGPLSPVVREYLSKIYKTKRGEP